MRDIVVGLCCALVGCGTLTFLALGWLVILT